MTEFAWNKRAENKTAELQISEVSPAVFAQAMSEINEEYGDCTPELVIAKASAPESPIHNLFIWDDTEAAKKFRLFQAAYAIRSIQVVRLSAPSTPRQQRVVVERPEENSESEFLTIERALADKGSRPLFVQKVIAELRGARERYGDLTELDEVWNSIDRV